MWFVRCLMLFDTHMDLCNESCSAGTGHPSVLCGKNLNVGHYLQNVQPKFYIAAMLLGTIWLLPFCTTFTDLDIAWGSQGQHKAKPAGFIFSQTFPLIRMKFDMMMKQFKLNILRLLLREIYGNKGNDCCFTLTCIWTFMNWFDSNLVWW